MEGAMRARVLLLVGRVHVLRPSVLVIALEPARFLALPAFTALLLHDSLPSSTPEERYALFEPMPSIRDSNGKTCGLCAASGGAATTECCRPGPLGLTCQAQEFTPCDMGRGIRGKPLLRGLPGRHCGSTPKGADITLRDVEAHLLDLLELAEALGGDVRVADRDASAAAGANPPRRDGDRPLSAGQDTCEPIRAATSVRRATRPADGFPGAGPGARRPGSRTRRPA